MNHARFRVASLRVRCTRGMPALPGDPTTASDATWHVVGAVREPPLQRVRPRAAMFVGTTHAAARGACRGDAVRRPGAIVHDGTASSRVPTHHGPAGLTTGSPLHSPPVGSARSSGWTERCRLFPTKQERDASPWQGEAGAERRVRVDPAVHVGATRCLALVRSCAMAPHHPGCPRATAPPG